MYKIQNHAENIFPNCTSTIEQLAEMSHTTSKFKNKHFIDIRHRNTKDIQTPHNA